MIRLLIAAGAAVIIFGIGVAILRMLVTPPPAPPPAGELRRVKIGYRCDLCGAELRMTVAATEDPDAPRHCQEEMTLLTPVDE